MSAQFLEGPWVFRDGLNRPQRTSYGVFIDLDDPAGMPSPDPFALHRVDFAVKFNGRVVELTWEQVLRKLGLRQ